MGMAVQNGPKTAGKKPSSRKRSNAKPQPVKEYVDVFQNDEYEGGNLTGSVPSMVFAHPIRISSSTTTAASTPTVRPAQTLQHLASPSFPVSIPCNRSAPTSPFASCHIPSTAVTTSIPTRHQTLFPPTFGEGTHFEPSTVCNPSSISSMPPSCTPTFSQHNSMPYQFPFHPQSPAFSHAVTSPLQLHSPTQSCAGNISSTTQNAASSNSNFIRTHLSNANDVKIFNLKWVPGTTVSKCYGCHNKIENSPQALPDDLIIVHRDIREYRDRITGQLQRSTSAQNVHFHLRASCVSRRYPDFHARNLQVQPQFIPLLRPEHFERLFNEFGLVYNL